MKKLILGYCLLAAISCDTTLDKRTEVVLDNNLGIIELTLSEDYNEFQKTFKNSDCGCCCDQIWNIFYSSEKDLLPKEDTLPYFMGIDYQSTPGYRLTISQPSCTDCFGGVDIDIRDQLEKTIEALKNENPKRDLNNYEIMEIDNQYFMVISIRDTIKGFIHEEVQATAYLNDGPVDLTFYRHGTGSSDFIDESLRILKTISIK
jgi:hypothetical protein